MLPPCRWLVALACLAVPVACEAAQPPSVEAVSAVALDGLADRQVAAPALAADGLWPEPAASEAPPVPAPLPAYPLVRGDAALAAALGPAPESGVPLIEVWDNWTHLLYLNSWDIAFAQAFLPPPARLDAYHDQPGLRLYLAADGPKAPALMIEGRMQVGFGFDAAPRLFLHDKAGWREFEPFSEARFQDGFAPPGAFPVYAVDGPRVRLSPAGDDPVWLDLSRIEGLAYQLMQNDADVSGADDIASFTDAPLLLHAAPGDEAPVILRAGDETLAAELAARGIRALAPYHILRPAGEPRGDWLPVEAVVYDTGTAPEEYCIRFYMHEPARFEIARIPGWIRWRQPDGIHAVEWISAQQACP